LSAVSDAANQLANILDKNRLPQKTRPDRMAMKLVISGASGIGDLIMLTPALRRLKELRPDYDISLFVDHNTKSIVAGLPYITNIFTRKRGELLSRYHFIPELCGRTFSYFWTGNRMLLIYYTCSEREIFSARQIQIFCEE
jgi:hypothetical protein